MADSSNILNLLHDIPMDAIKQHDSDENWVSNMLGL